MAKKPKIYKFIDRNGFPCSNTVGFGKDTRTEPVRPRDQLSGRRPYSASRNSNA